MIANFVKDNYDDDITICLNNVDKVQINGKTYRVEDISALFRNLTILRDIFDYENLYDRKFGTLEISVIDYLTGRRQSKLF